MRAIDWKSVSALIKYDWVNNRKSFLYLTAVLEACIILLGISIYASNGFFNNKNFGDVMIGVFPSVVGAFYIFWMCTVVWYLKLVHRKYSRKISATDYVMLPANTLEKAVCIHIEYVACFLICILIYMLNYIFFFGLTVLTTIHSSNLDSEIFNIIDNIHKTLFSGGSGDFIATVLIMDFTVYIMFMNLNMCFRKREIAKSFLSYFLILIAYGIYIFNLISRFLLNKDFVGFFDFDRFGYYTILTILIVPIILMFSAFKYQLKEREVK